MVCAVAQDGESGGLAGLVLQVGEQRGDGVELRCRRWLTIWSFGLQAGAGGGHGGLE